METWRIFVLSLLFAKMCKLEETSTPPTKSTTFVPLETVLFEKFKPVSFLNVLNSTNPLGIRDNATAQDAHIKLQKIANITISQFLNNQTKRNYSLSELLELKELADSIMDPNFMIPNFVKKSNSHLIALPSATMVNLASAILKSDFMPMGILQPQRTLKNKDAEKSKDGKLERKENQNDNKTTPTAYNATMDEALETMNFHRKMMNEFLCRNYVAESILDALERDASIFSDEYSSGFSERMGESEPEEIDPVAEMITDLGSSRYKDWLDKSAELTDVYKNMGGFEPNPYIIKPESPSDLPIEHRGDKRKNKDDDEEEEDDDDDEKETRKKPSKKKKKKRKKKPKPEVVDDAIEEEEEDEDDDDHEGEADSVLQVVDSHILSGGQHYEEEYSGWNIFRFGFEDFYDSALTAMAFLTFGMFTLQVFINLITNANAPRMGILVSNTTSAPPVNKRRRALNLEQIRIIEATERLPEEFTDNPKTFATTLVDENQNTSNMENEGTNFKAIPMLTTPIVENHSTSEKPTFEIIFGINVTPSIDVDPDSENTGEEPPVSRYIGPEDVVAKFALVTIRAALNKDEPRCLHAALCRANRATLQLEGPPRLWLPMWSVAMSWMAQRAGGIPGSEELISGALDNLRASVLGLAGVRCEEIYPPCLH